MKILGEPLAAGRQAPQISRKTRIQFCPRIFSIRASLIPCRERATVSSGSVSGIEISAGNFQGGAGYALDQRPLSVSRL